MAFAFQNISHSLKFDEICFLYETINDGRHDSQSANCGPKSKLHFYGESLVCGGVCLSVFPQGRFFTVLFNIAKRNISRSLCKYHCSGAEEKMNLDYYLPILSLTFAMLRWEYVPTGK